MKNRFHALFLSFGVVLLVAATLLVQCSSPEATSTPAAEHAAAPKGDPAAVAAWNVVYGVLQHPRCMNCHPMNDVPLQGDQSLPHAQNVQRGKDGHGLFAMRCETCHQTHNLPGAHLPPGAPNWHLPSKDMPLVFEGKSSGELCRQLRDLTRNGGKSPEQLFDHMAHDPLVLWGWSPGEGRTPVSTSHDELVQAMRTWIDHGCGCPER